MASVGVIVSTGRVILHAGGAPATRDRYPSARRPPPDRPATTRCNLLRRWPSKISLLIQNFSIQYSLRDQRAPVTLILSDYGGKYVALIMSIYDHLTQHLTSIQLWLITPYLNMNPLWSGRNINNNSVNPGYRHESLHYKPYNLFYLTELHTSSVTICNAYENFCLQ